MNILGLDLSLTHTGYAIVDDGGRVLAHGVIKSKPCGPKPVDEVRRITKIAHEVMEIIEGDPVLVCIENLAFMAQGTSLTQLAGLSYIVRALLNEDGYKFLMIAPTTLKKFITSSGKGDKDKMMMAVYKDYGFEASDNNECDGYSLAVCGLAVLGKPLKKLIKPQEEVIALLKKQL